ncbi:MAG: DUF4954 family protein [Bacteroidales bacterium]|nr:DUF4954 family protein [Bacteroidales bacterium]
MNSVLILSPENRSQNFISKEFLPKGEDEYYQRNKQTTPPESGWRHLRSDEVEILTTNGNTAENWDDFLVTDPFNPQQIKHSHFFGLVRIGGVRNVILQHHDLKVPSGITNSLLVSCDIGNDVAIHDVHYLAHYIVGDCCMLLNIDEMLVTDHAKFGNGMIKDGESEDVRIWLEPMNETGCRKVLPFDGMIAADAYLWAKYIDDSALQVNLKKITQNSMDSSRGYYGTTGNHCVIKNSHLIKDVKIGPHCYIKGASKLKNLTINSSEKESTQIGEGVILVNGIIGYGCQILYNSIALRFIIGNNSNLKYGARLLNSFLGDNSTISCCEVQHNLIFPAHEQHHNNSFLIAAVVMGQSNLAAGATMGSNHNSRSNDNEIQAGRGFWPGLCTSVKHSCRFASFTLLSKADYPSELDIPLPFSLLNNNVTDDKLEVMPAFWWLYNMYALVRNSWKYQARDHRAQKNQHIEFDHLAPDTIEEVLVARRLLEIWTAKAALHQEGKSVESFNQDQLAETGRKLFSGDAVLVNGLEVLGEKMECSKRKVVIVKAYNAWHAYGDMMHYYAVKNLLDFMALTPEATFQSMCKDLKGKRPSEWINLGGQLVQKEDLDELRSDIRTGKLDSWKDIHGRYDTLWERYSLDKQKHAYAILCEQLEVEQLTESLWQSALEKAVDIQHYICDQVYASRKKDYDNQFRKTTFRNSDEMKAAIGTIDDNSFIVRVREETNDFMASIEKAKKNLKNPVL